MTNSQIDQAKFRKYLCKFLWWVAQIAMRSEWIVGGLLLFALIFVLWKYWRDGE